MLLSELSVLTPLFCSVNELDSVFDKTVSSFFADLSFLILYYSWFCHIDEEPKHFAVNVLSFFIVDCLFF